MPDQNNPSHHRFWSLLSKKLSNEITAEELAELHFILLKNPELQHRADMLSEMWQQKTENNCLENEAVYMRHIMKHKDEFFVEENPVETNGDVRIAESNPGFSQNIFPKKRVTVFALMAFIILTTGAIYLFTQKESTDLPTEQSISSVVTKNGNRTKIVLPDGSQVWLNAGSNLDYNNSVFNKDLREVTLNGEAYFDVTKNADKPFIIHTKKMDIKVTGTTFNVRSYNDEKIAEASLIRGSIEVTLKDRKDQKIILKPNEKISIATQETGTPASKTEKTKAAKNTKPIPQIVVKELKPNPVYNIIPEIAWTQNKLFFEDESLENIALMMERWFGKKVVVTNASLKNLHYYGNFENETIEEVLSYLKLSRSFNFKIEHDSVMIY
jgi:ferric-dicitrate binding protein FerR (iron transport regulator)